MNGNKINQIYTFHIFALVFLFFSFSLQLDLLAAATTSKIVMVQASPPSRRRLVRRSTSSKPGGTSAIGFNKIGQSDLSNWTFRFLQFRTGDLTN
jgi:hypothetical protein